MTSSEPVLLVGETGVGKTTSVQFLAEKTGRRLRVVNMNQQSDSADLLGGFKPVSLQRSLHKLREQFTQLFCQTFSTSNNAMPSSLVILTHVSMIRGGVMPFN